MSQLITFDEVSFAYPHAREWALRKVSFAVGEGEACALLGPNGCGKSTSLRLLLGLDHPREGEVLFDGQRIDAASMANRTFAKRLRQRVGLVFQDPDVQLFCPTVADEVAFAPRQMGLDEVEVERRVADCLLLFALEELSERAPWRLSGGEKRRCAIACVVSASPDVLCLDEPTNDLDQASRDLVVGFLRSYVTSGKTVLVATHDLGLVESIGARVVSLGGAD